MVDNLFTCHEIEQIIEETRLLTSIADLKRSSSFSFSLRNNLSVPLRGGVFIVVIFQLDSN